MLKTRQIRLHTTGVLTGKHAIVHKTKCFFFLFIFVHLNQFYYRKIQIDNKNTWRKNVAYIPCKVQNKHYHGTENDIKAE